MTDTCFAALCAELTPHIRHTSLFPVREKVALFLQYVGQAASERKLEEDFQRPRSKVHDTKEQVRDAIVEHLYSRYVTDLQRPATVAALHEKHVPGNHDLSWEMRGGALAADGVHFEHTVPKAKANAYRNRKGVTSTNALMACTFDGFFAYAFAGAEGQHCDPKLLQVVRDAFFSTLSTVIELHGERIVTYFLVDAIFGLEERLMTPYRGIRYHLKEWEGKQPQNSQELFNLQHAKLRNVIERAFGILKRRFKILREPSECETDHHVKYIYASVALHNFIKVHKGDVDDRFLDDPLVYIDDDGVDKDVQGYQQLIQQGGNTAALYQAALIKRETLAMAMWAVYRRQRAQRGDPLP
jgi:hypothetical protein